MDSDHSIENITVPAIVVVVMLTLWGALSTVSSLVASVEQVKQVRLAEAEQIKALRPAPLNQVKRIQ